MRRSPSPARQGTRSVKLYDRKTPITAADLLNDRVVPFFDEHGIMLSRILTDRGTEYCGTPERHEYELYLAVENIDHSRTKTKSPQTNGICERFRPDHGSPFMSEHFQNQLKFFGMAPSFAFVWQPETNGVAERFIRTLKEQIVLGRIFQDIEEVRAALRAYFDRYNQHWLLEKNGYRSPAETRRNWMAAAVTTHKAA